ncbi:hypothetical protein NESM_000391800 [Novymonas esmeraldas]|uniref:Uncharacterized protein n=1 Tax=Novymonas esmeraldas TaxID=1808958 RepID=A0AAW0EMQ5_9TRYP
MAMENPFESLRPALRSEEDEIRKGVFSQALRNLQHASLDERRRWCSVIRESAARRTGGAKTRAKSATVLPVTGQPATAIASAGASPLPQHNGNGAVAVATAADVAPSPALPQVDASAGKKRTRSDDDDDDVDTVSKATTLEGQHRGQTSPTDGEPEESVKECIAAYMRGLLDRVVGTGIDNLAVPALKVLCMMLGIKTEVSNKMGLYSILADFYFSKCAKLGKRVSRDTVFERQVEQEVAMLRNLPSASSSSSPPSSASRAERRAAAPATTPSAATSAAAPAVKVAKAEEAGEARVAAARVRRETAPLPKATKLAKVAAAAAPLPTDAVTAHYLKYEHYPDELVDDAVAGPSSWSGGEYGGEVVYEPRVFTRPGNSSSGAATAAHMAKYQASDKDDEAWSLPLLERKVASIVQLYDPVTVAIVVKKLAQMGYRDGGAEACVEQILRRFHERQLIFYDDGIAYLM